ncbi:MAG TPA: sodium:proton antiporter [Chthoniobacteraceae bacterium]|nr:sodium:proton antiporter [Chthoniobacteraceae bacterium]
MLIAPLLAAAASGPGPNPWMLLPFALLLLCIALGPLAAPHFWHRWFHIAAIGFGAISVAYYLLVLRQPLPMLHVAEEYLSFIALIGSLFVVAGGIHIRVKGQATPGVNCLFLFIGAVLANVIGTTGASMLLIRPWLRMNKYRVTAFHVVFFIFIVSNIGGCLTPIGDPPLFLGYLKGVPFWWVIQHCWQAWLVGVFGLISVFYVLDWRNFRRAPRAIREKETAHEEWRFDGLHNSIFLAAILVGVFLPFGWREAVMVGAALASWFSTSRRIHESNAFDFFPIKEVAWLFAGIFTTMVPALQYLELHAGEFGLHSPLQFYWLTGVLSGVLDNAPTYLAFLATAFGLNQLDMDVAADVQAFVSQQTHLLKAISIGAVFFGALTYIGNGPNFMVKAIAEHQKVATPTFLGYLLRYSIPILLPFLFLVGLLFFSRTPVL